MTLIYQKKNKYFLAVVILLGLLVPQFLWAQSSVSLSVSPTIFEMTANPSQRWESNLRIINNNPFELTVYAEINNFRPLGEEGAAQFLPVDDTTTPGSTLAEWITVPSTAIVIPPEQTAQIPIVIELPADVPPGGHYAAILVGTRPPADRENASQVATAQMVSSLIFLRVTGDIIEEGSIRSFRTTQSIVETPKVDFELRFQNDGNVHLRPEGQITIFNMWGQERGRVPINQKTLFGNVMRESIRSFNFSWEGEWSPVDIGRYRAEATLAYGEDARKFTYSETSFWLIPWRALLGIILVLSVIAVLLAWLVKLYVRRMLSIAGYTEESAVITQSVVPVKSKQVSVMAPIEAGILDLRSRLRTKDTRKMDVLIDYIFEYKLFFIGLLIVLIVIYLATWFVGAVSEDKRAFEVTVSGLEQDVTVNSESLEYQEQQSETAMIKKDVPPLRLINRSGINGGAADVALALEELGYTIDTVSTDLNQTENQTIIVYNPEYQEAALELSDILDDALLSAYSGGGETDSQITVYVGSDIVQ